MAPTPNTVILSTVGEDRPGIVAAVCEVLSEFGCNIEDSTMTRLGNQFATLVKIGMPSTIDYDAFQHAFFAVEAKLGATFFIRPVEDNETSILPTGSPYILTVGGPDRVGITLSVSKMLAKHQVNIMDLQAKRMTSEEGPVYLLLIEVDVPNETSMPNLEADLNTLKDSEQLDIQLRPREASVL